MFSQTTYTVALSGDHKQNDYLDTDVYVRLCTSPFVQQGHNGTVTATRVKTTQQGEGT